MFLKKIITEYNNSVNNNALPGLTISRYNGHYRGKEKEFGVTLAVVCITRTRQFQCSAVRSSMDKYDPRGASFIAMVPGVVRLFHGAYSLRFLSHSDALWLRCRLFLWSYYTRNTHMHTYATLSVFLYNF